MRISSLNLIIVFTTLMLCSDAFAVNSNTVRQSSASQFLKGETDNTSIDSKGTISLSRQSAEIDLGDALGEAWIINDIVTDDEGNTYAATSPNGRVIKYSDGKAEIIYPIDEEADESESVTPFVNVHVFALALDKQGRLLAGISGTECKLIRFDNGKPVTILEPEKSNYIHDITLDKAGNIYIATGPEGIVYRMGPTGKVVTEVYDSQDENILTLAIDENNFIFAGSDTRGLVYKIHPFNKTASVLFDSKQDEITDIIIDENGDLYATATSAKSVSSKARASGIAMAETEGRPDSEENGSKPVEEADSENENKEDKGKEIKTANTDKKDSGSSAAPPEQIERGVSPKTAGSVYRIDQKGFVTEIFSDMSVFFGMAKQGSDILLATGNEAELFSINPKTEKKALAYKDEKSSQITAIKVIGDKVLVATANPAKLIELSSDFTAEGTYISDLIDAGQPAHWGKLQIDAEIPEGTKIMLQSRSGNVKDPNDPTFSEWSEAAQITEATQIECPVARFCQYKLKLTTDHAKETPEISTVAVSNVIPNLAPKVIYVKTARSRDPKEEGFTIVSFTAVDLNKDKLRFKVEFRKVGRTRWIELEDKLEKPKYEWDTKTVEDGRYEIRITANDEISNTVETALGGSRLSNPFVVDNTAPVITEEDVNVDGKIATLKLTVRDEFTAIGNVSFTVDSNKDYNSTLPDDLVYDTTSEDFTIKINDLKPGEHVISVKISDDIDNIMYKSYEINVE